MALNSVMIFEDISAVTIQDPYQEEERFITLGRDAHNRILVVIYAYQKEVIRIISARKANKKERTFYEKGEL